MRSPIRQRHTTCNNVLLSRINSPAFSLLFSTSSFRLCFVTSDDARLRNTHTTDNTLILVLTGNDVEKRIKSYDLSRIYAFYSLDIPKKKIFDHSTFASLLCAPVLQLLLYSMTNNEHGEKTFFCAVTLDMTCIRCHRSMNHYHFQNYLFT